MMMPVYRSTQNKMLEKENAHNIKAGVEKQKDTNNKSKKQRILNKNNTCTYASI